MKIRIDKVIVAIAAAGVMVFGLGATDEPIKVGVVDLEQAMLSTDAGKQAREELERKAREAESKLQPMIEEYRTKLQEFESKKFVLSEDASRTKQLDLLELKNAIENKKKEMEGQLQLDRERIIGPLLERLRVVVDAVGKDEGFSLILMRGSPGIIYAREALDITDLIVKRFDEKG